MAFRTTLTIRFGDIDYAGIVYYPRIVHFFHVAMEEFFSKGLGNDYARVLKEHRLGLPTVHLEADFRRPFQFGDRVDVEVFVEHLGNRSIRWRYRIFQQSSDEISVEGRVVTACVDLDTFTTISVPDWLREEVQGLQGEESP